MTLELAPPRIDGKSKGVRDIIVDVLSKEWPLTARKIHNVVKSRGVDVTYQAVHKAIYKLLGDEILVKAPGGYQLNEEWIKDIREFCENLEKSYNHRSSNLQNMNPQTMIFETQIDMGKFLLDAIDKNLLGNFRELYCNWSFVWSTLPFSKKEYTQLKSILTKKRCCIISSDNRYYTKWHADVWRKNGARVKIGVKDAPKMDYLVYGPFVIQVFWGKEIRDSQEKYLSTIKSHRDINADVLKVMYEDIINQKGEILVTMIKDQKLAEKLGGRVLKNFSR